MAIGTEEQGGVKNDPKMGKSDDSLLGLGKADSLVSKTADWEGP